MLLPRLVQCLELTLLLIHFHPNLLYSIDPNSPFFAGSSFWAVVYNSFLFRMILFSSVNFFSADIICHNILTIFRKFSGMGIRSCFL